MAAVSDEGQTEDGCTSRVSAVFGERAAAACYVGLP